MVGVAVVMAGQGMHTDVEHVGRGTMLVRNHSCSHTFILADNGKKFLDDNRSMKFDALKTTPNRILGVWNHCTLGIALKKKFFSI